MKARLVIALTGLTLVTLTAPSAQAGVRIGLGINIPLFAPCWHPCPCRTYVAPAPVYVAPAPVYVVPAQPVYVQQAPVAYQAVPPPAIQPTTAYAPPVVLPPAPIPVTAGPR